VPGRNLSHYNIFFTGKTEDGKIKNYSIYDLEPAKELFKLQYGESNSDKIQLRRNLQ
jgi:L-rhamnose mutarotase